MNYRIIFHVFGWICLIEGILLLFPMIVAAVYGESAIPLLLTVLICWVLAAFLLFAIRADNSQFNLREGFVIAALGWLLLSMLGALPFVFSGAIPNYIDALFESASGFTTTGASILPDVEALPKSILFWRSETHWIGGMGVLVFLLMIMPKSGASYTNLMKAESTGPQVEKLVPSIRSSAFILYGIYIAMTVIQFIILAIAKMPVFDNFILTFGTAGTGGFGSLADSVASYTTAQQNIITVFMILFGVNFSFYYYLLLKKPGKAIAMEEVRWYFGIIAAAILMITVNISGDVGNFWTAMQQAAFQVASIITTTGFATVDFDLWPNFSRTILVLLMIIGACAGSTGGGFKVSRIILVCKNIRTQLHQVLHPRRICNTRVDGKTLPKDVIETTNAYLAAYVLIFAVSIFVVSLDGYDLTTNFTAVAATFNNIGPGLSLVGPTQNFAFYSPAIKLLLTGLMLAGRLEIFPFLILFSKETWRRY